MADTPTCAEGPRALLAVCRQARREGSGCPQEAGGQVMTAQGFFDYLAAQPIVWVLGGIAVVFLVGSLIGGRR